MTAKTEFSLLPGWLVWLASLLTVNLVGLGILWLSLQSAIAAYIAIAIALLVFPTLIMVRDRLLGEYFTLLGFLILVGVAALLASNYYELRSGTSISDISVTQAADYPDASQFRFTDGAVRTELTGQRIVRSRSGDRTNRQYYFVAPIVPADWQPSEPVPAWAGCTNTGSAVNVCQGDWPRPYQAGLRIARDLRNYEQAITDAVAQYNLQTAERAPILEWVADPSLALRNRGRSAVGLWMGVNVIFAIAPAPRPLALPDAPGD
ncbi:MAG: hypothetical protein HC910_21805 [Spirulinaceae cyanobacterium SM2_1_0]|nr:hypothetical protein [Spirulinaceae cyanobacterium SM2_1_0]